MILVHYCLMAVGKFRPVPLWAGYAVCESCRDEAYGEARCLFDKHGNKYLPLMSEEGVGELLPPPHSDGDISERHDF